MVSSVAPTASYVRYILSLNEVVTTGFSRKVKKFDLTL